MKIYIAGSWKNAKRLHDIAADLRDKGHLVDLFCDDSAGRYVFGFSELGDVSKLDAKSIRVFPNVWRAFKEDKKWIDWADAVLLVLPSGKSAHLEAGYAVGKGKQLYIYGGELPKGEVDVMYFFANGVYDDFDELLFVLKQPFI